MIHLHRSGVFYAYLETKSWLYKDWLVMHLTHMNNYMITKKHLTYKYIPKYHRTLYNHKTKQ